MSGAEGLAGYIYQQDYVTYRLLTSAVLADVAEKLAARRVISYSIEGWTSHDAPIWDVRFDLADNRIELLECKNTNITREDRRTFYKRIREEVGSGTAIHQLAVGWVTDSNKQSGSHLLDHLEGMKALSLHDKTGPPTACPSRVHDADSALKEALFRLCVDTTSASSALSPEEARELLSRLVIERHAAQGLKHAVETLAVELPFGTGEAIRKVFVGTFSTQIAGSLHASGSLASILEEVGKVAEIAALGGELRRFILTYSAAAKTPPPLLTIRWQELEGEPETKWSVFERLPDLDLARSCVVIGPQGTGKTTTTVQAWMELRAKYDRHHLLLADAGLLESEWIRKIPGFCAILCALSPTWIALDGLDKVKREHKEAWQDCLNRLLPLTNLTALATARTEVLAAGEWLQSLSSVLKGIELDTLTANQVGAAFNGVGLAAPRSLDLIDALRNPFLFSIYARIAKPDSSPLGIGGRITGFRIIREFWKRRITAPSDGHRLVGLEANSSFAKRRAMAHLVQMTAGGLLVFDRTTSSDTLDHGVQMLIHEGALLEQGTYAVRWFHDWLREYALIDWLVGRAKSVGAEALAALVCQVEVDHVARTAAIGAAKWAIMDDSWGPVEHYLHFLHEAKPGYASEALASILEESESHLCLARLSDNLLIEAVDMARRMNASQWHAQVVSLPASRFMGNLGSQLLDVATRYEMELLPA